MKKIVVVGGMIKGVGISKYIMDTYAAISQTHNSAFHISFVNESGKNDYQNEMQQLRWNSTYICPWRKNPINYFWDWFRFLSKNHNEIDVIHFHYDQLSKFWPFLLLKFFPVKHVIVHSHNSSNTDMQKRWFMRLSNWIGKGIVSRMHITRFAVSYEAGKWLFGKSKFKIVHNGVNTQNYKFNKIERRKYRQEFDIGNNEIALVNIGRFQAQKNHSFLIRAFSKAHKEFPNTKLFLIGIGPLQYKVKQLVKKLGLEKSVIFLNLRNDVPDIISAFDIFLLPSLYEGFPISLVEAQANGLPIIYSNRVSKKIELTKFIRSASINEIDEWSLSIKKIIENKSDFKTRAKQYEVVSSMGYDLFLESEKLADFYMALS